LLRATFCGVITQYLDCSQGKKTKVGDEIEMPEISAQPYKSLAAPACARETKVENCAWFAEKVTSFGGAAGKGPDQLPPTSLPDDNTADSSLIVDEIDAEVENKTKMAFAKMQIPNELRTRYLLTEADFALNENTENEDGADNNGTMTGSRLEDMPDLGLESSGSPRSPQLQPSPGHGGEASPKPGSGQKIGRQASRQEANDDENKGRRGSPGRSRMNRQASTEGRAAADSKDSGADSPGKPKRPRSRQTREKDAISMSEKASQLGLYA
jgi:hypothetical protein